MSRVMVSRVGQRKNKSAINRNTQTQHDDYLKMKDNINEIPEEVIKWPTGTILNCRRLVLQSSR